MSWIFMGWFVERGVIASANFSVFGYLALVVGALASLLICRNMWSYWVRRAKLMKFALTLPGPPTVPILGNALEFAVSPDETFDKIAELVRNNEATFRFWLGPKLVVILTDPRDYEIVLASSRASYKDPVYQMMEPAVGQGLVSGSGPTHRLHRKIIMPMLNGKALMTYLRYFNTHSRYCAHLLEDKVGGEEFDILPFMTNCTTDMMLETIVGITGTAQKGGYKQFIHYSDRIYEFIHMRMVKVWLHPDFIFNHTAMGEEQKTGLKIIHGIIDNAIQRAKKEYLAVKRGAVVEDRPRVMLLEQMVDHAMRNNSMDDLELRYELYTVYIAAQDTVAVISSFAFLMLAMHPEIQNKVREEVTEVLGDCDDVDEEHLSNLKYLEMVIKETLRLFPIAPLMVRKTTGEVQLETCTLPEDCSIVMVAFMTQRDERHWKKPETFDPDRFLPENTRERHPYAYVPFSGGVRGCLGQKFAIICLKTLIANLIRRYHFETKQKLSELKLKMDISIRSRNGYKILVRKI